MDYRKLLLGVVIISVGVYVAYATISPKLNPTKNIQKERSSNKDSRVTTATTIPSSDSKSVTAETQAENVIKTPVSQTPLEAAVVYSLAEVAIHGTENDCWTAVNGTVYDLTPFIKKHPGGKENIMRICGIDGTKAFEGQHGGDSKPENMLAGLEIGILK